MALQVPIGILHHSLATSNPQTSQANIQFFKFLLNALALRLVPHHKVTFAATSHIVRETQEIEGLWTAMLILFAARLRQVSEPMNGCFTWFCLKVKLCQSNL